MTATTAVTGTGPLAAPAELVGPTSAAVLRLHRAWPRAADHLLLEYRDENSTVAGQWFADGARASHVAERTAALAPGQVALVADAGVVLQAGGADRRLVALAGLVRRPGAELVCHRPERRAVVRLAGAAVTYAKLARAGATSRLVAGSALEGVRVPGVVSHDVEAGLVELAAMPGRSLHELLGDPGAPAGQIAAAFEATGTALRALHETEPGAGVGRHDAATEWAVTERWLTLAQAHKALPPEARATARRTARDVRSLLELARGTGRLALVHRDLHDKQVLVDEGGEVGLLDFDTLAVGDPALDLANLIVHLELRVHQRWCSFAEASQATASLLAGYGSMQASSEALAAYAAATRVRLACVYAFRPPWRYLCPRLLEPLVAV